MSFRNRFLLTRSGTIGFFSKESQNAVTLGAARGTLVLADADAVELWHLASILGTLDYRILTAQDGETAFRLAKQHRAQLILSSLRLPVLDGYKLCQRIRQDPATEHIPFMFISQQGEIPDQVIGHESYANDYIQKPISIPELKSRILSLLRRGPFGGDGVGGWRPADWGEARSGERNTMAENMQSRKKGGEDEDLRRSSDEGCGKSIEEILDEFRRSERSRKPRLPAEGPPPASGPPEVELVRPVSVHRPDATEEALSPLGVTVEETSRAQEMPSEADQLLSRYLEEYRERVAQEAPGREACLRQEVHGIEDILSEFRSREAFRTVRVSPEGEPEARRPSFARPSEVSAAPGQERPPEAHPPQVENLLGREEASLKTPRAGQVPALYGEARLYVLESLRQAEASQPPEIRKGLELARRMADDLRQGRELLLAATNRSQQFTITGHSVNVAVVAVRIAHSLNYSPEDQERIILSSLLHELGVVKMPEELIYKSGALTEQEIRLVRERPVHTARLLEPLGHQYGWLRDNVCQIFEREDGSGFPAGLSGREIREEAKIIGIANVFEACIHDRPTRKARTGHQALFELTVEGGKSFPDYLVKALIKAFSLYPYNEYVVLNTGETAQVVDINHENLSRPVVAILYESDGKKRSEAKRTDLAQNPSLYITRAITAEDLPDA